MLHGLIQTESMIEKMLRTLDVSMYEFYLTGSRFFSLKKLEDNTDYDFFTEDTPSIRGFLSTLNFRPLTEGDTHNLYLGDPTIVAVYRYVFEKEPHIDIQIVGDINKKIRVNNLIFKLYPFFGKNITSKHIRQDIWKILMSS